MRALLAPWPAPADVDELPSITSEQRDECRHCGRAIVRSAGRRTGIGAWWHVAWGKCTRPSPGAPW